MHIIARDVIERPYKLIGLNYQNMPVSCSEYATLEELARAASSSSYYLQRNMSDGYRLWNEAVQQRATGLRGKPLVLEELVAWGRRLRYSSYYGRYGCYVYRNGPVSGIRKWRGGSTNTNARTQSERRQNGMVVKEDGEVPARAVRTGFHLPCSWDGRYRQNERCWKSQHKGGKSWDRPARHGDNV
jgi:hypothetical protein